jgi:hypothetical protein
MYKTDGTFERGIKAFTALAPGDYAELGAYAKAAGTSRSALIRDILVEWLTAPVTLSDIVVPPDNEKMEGQNVQSTA